MPLHKPIIKQLQERSNRRCRIALEDFYKVSFYTIEKWIKTNDRSLTTPESLTIISAYLNIEKKDLFFITESVLDSVSALQNVPQH